MTTLEKARVLSDKVASQARLAADVYQQLGTLLAELGEALGELETEPRKKPSRKPAAGSGRRGRGWTEEGARRRIVEVIRDYRGMPLNLEDVRDEVGHISHTRARQVLGALVEEGAIASRRVAGNVTVYYDHTVTEEEAAA